VKKLEQITAPIANELRLFEDYFEQTLRAETEPMDGIMRYVQQTQGKRIRPILVLLSARIFGTVNEQTLRGATFVEMLHSATLIHDDVVDDSETRRSQASVKAHFGNLSAVLAGDYLLAKAMLLLSNPVDHAILRETLYTAAAMSEGELMQDLALKSLDKSNPSYPTMTETSTSLDDNSLFGTSSKTNDYLDIITRKTAMLMRSCCITGALSVNATPKQVKQIADFGINFGILFQLHDDILDADHAETVSIAKVLLPQYLERALTCLEVFPSTEISDALYELTRFCAQFGQYS